MDTEARIGSLYKRYKRPKEESEKAGEDCKDGFLTIEEIIKKKVNRKA